MLYDFQTHKKFANYDLCIVGGGPAGITLALQLGRVGKRVALLEGGGLDYSEPSQSLYEVKSEGTDLYARSARLRYLGGTSNHWSGRCRPFVAADFETPPPGGIPGWPISFEEFNRTLPEAMRILDLPAQGFKAINSELPDGKFAADSFAMSAPTRFLGKYREELAASKQIDVFYYCNCVDLLFDRAASRITAIKLVDYQKNSQQLSARRFVLAMGAIENARTLLNSDSINKAGLSGMNWTGRCFMEHLNVSLGTFIPANSERFSEAEYFPEASFVQQAGIGRGNISFGVVKEVTSYGRTAAVKNFVKNLACNLGMAEKIQFIQDFQCPGAGTIGTLLEQFPNPDISRITLSDERDALGVRKAIVKWNITDHDKRTIRTLGKEIAKSFATAGLGFVKLNDFILDERAAIPVAHHCHHMGTTRMAETERWGVVDRNCQVFGVNNLFVAGSSVFPTGGGGNPTMPLLQLGLRLGGHLLKN